MLIQGHNVIFQGAREFTNTTKDGQTIKKTSCRAIEENCEYLLQSSSVDLRTLPKMQPVTFSANVVGLFGGKKGVYLDIDTISVDGQSSKSK